MLRFSAPFMIRSWFSGTDSVGVPRRLQNEQSHRAAFSSRSLG
ncbi:hypothetical protein [Marivita sp. S0852]